MGKKIDSIIGIIVVLLLIVTAYVFSQQYIEFKEQQNHIDNPPFDISAWNQDVKNHDMTVEVLDVDNNTLFTASYNIEPQKIVLSPIITTEKGDYLVKITLDGNITKNTNVHLNEDKTLDILISSDNIDLGYSMP